MMIGLGKARRRIFYLLTEFMAAKRNRNPENYNVIWGYQYHSPRARSKTRVTNGDDI